MGVVIDISTIVNGRRVTAAALVSERIEEARQLRLAIRETERAVDRQIAVLHDPGTEPMAVEEASNALIVLGELLCARRIALRRLLAHPLAN